MSVKTALSKLETAVAGYTDEADAFLTRMGKGQLDPDIIEKTLNDATEKAIQDILAQIDGLDIAELTARSEIQRKLVGIQNAYDPNSKLAFEFFAPLYTISDTLSVGNVKTVTGDDSVDCATTATLTVGKEYIVEGTGGPLTVTVAEILSATRFRAASTASVSITGGTLKRTNWVQHNGYASVDAGKVYYAAALNMDASTGGNKSIIIRSTGNEASFALFFKDATHTSWAAIPWTYKRTVIADPTYTDVEYAFPANGSFELKVVSNVTATVKHMVVMSHVSGLGGTARAPETPVNVYPVNGKIDVVETPTIAINGYHHAASVPFKSATIQISARSDFNDTVYNVTISGTSLTVPAGILLANTTYYWRAQVQDANRAISDWSIPTSFTTLVTYAYVNTPLNISPGNGAIDIKNGVVLSTSSFSVVGASGIQVASQYQISTDTLFLTGVVYDSGEDSSNFTSVTVPEKPLSENSLYYWRCRHKDKNLGWSDWSTATSFMSAEHFVLVTGVALLATGVSGGSWAYVDASGNTVSRNSTYFNTHPVFGGMQDVMIDGQYMVKIPKFYYKRAIISGGANNGKEAWWISDQPVDGYVVHPAFKSSGAVIDQIYVGKYQASMDGSKLGSKPGVLPAVGRSLTQFQTDASARNVSGVSGFGLWSVYHWSAIQWLYLVENATMDSQSETGQGRVSAPSAANVDASDVAQATYRGIVGLWGNVWQWMDGLKAISGVINLWDREGNQTWVNTGQTPPNINSSTYPVTFMDANGSGYDMDDVFIGKTGPTNNSGATAPDYQYWNDSAGSFPIVGGAWSPGAAAGLWHVTCGDAASNSSPYFGARLAKV